MRYVIPFAIAAAVCRFVYRSGAYAATLQPEGQIDYWWVPLCGALFGYSVFVSVVLIVVGNGWTRSAGNMPSSNDTANSNTKEG